ncbi:hypothetical protein HGRIS_013438 [Hohenbuehelia grisea]|uniref:Calcineurin-like phosphoesterase domain-containing protein n=1 Tax=Hohenbuehelia grisea TaxID=104357 RepID=A0ABR3IVQ6_9AGAR
MQHNHYDAASTPGPTCAVYDDYDIQRVPPHPGPGWTRFVCISDTHSRRFAVPPGDVLLHAGDLSSWGLVSQLKQTIDWLKRLDHPIKVIIAGNHDLCLDAEVVEEYPGLLDKKTPQGGPHSLLRNADALAAGLVYLEHESCIIRTKAGREWKVYGSPAAPRYCHGAFQYTNSLEGDEIYSRIPDDVEILLTHTPPHGMLDLSKKGTNAGCRSLAERLKTLSACRLHVFGHIHEAHGATVIPRDGERGERAAVNAALGHRNPIIVDFLN